MTKIIPLLYLATIAAIGILLLRMFQGAKSAAVTVVDTARNLISPSGASPLANPVSTWVGGLFKSTTEKEVDAMYGNKPVARVLPGSEYENTPTSFYNTPVIGRNEGNPLPGPQTTVGIITQPAVNYGGAPRATNTPISSENLSLNQPPPVTTVPWWPWGR